MEKNDYNTTIKVNAAPAAVFISINAVADWWSGNFEGHSTKPNDVFTVRFGETSITIKVIELIPGRKIGWQVIDCYKHWLKDKKEWKDTTVLWEIVEEQNKTQITFTHFGLVPGIECYKGCEKAWDFYIKESLVKLINEGKGIPELK